MELPPSCASAASDGDVEPVTPTTGGGRGRERERERALEGSPGWGREGGRVAASASFPAGPCRVPRGGPQLKSSPGRAPPPAGLGRAGPPDDGLPPGRTNDRTARRRDGPLASPPERRGGRPASGARGPGRPRAHDRGRGLYGRAGWARWGGGRPWGGTHLRRRGGPSCWRGARRGPRPRGARPPPRPCGRGSGAGCGPSRPRPRPRPRPPSSRTAPPARARPLLSCGRPPRRSERRPKTKFVWRRRSIP